MSYIASPAHLKAYALALLFLAAAFLHDAAYSRVAVPSLPPQKNEVQMSELTELIEASRDIAYYARERVADHELHGLDIPEQRADVARWSRWLTALEQAEPRT